MIGFPASLNKDQKDKTDGPRNVVDRFGPPGNGNADYVIILPAINYKKVKLGIWKSMSRS